MTQVTSRLVQAERKEIAFHEHLVMQQGMKQERRQERMSDEESGMRDDVVSRVSCLTYLLICSWECTTGHVTGVSTDVFLLNLHVLLQTERIDGDFVIQSTV